MGGAKPSQGEMNATAAEEREARLLRKSVNHHETLDAESVEEREQRRLVWRACSFTKSLWARQTRKMATCRRKGHLY